MTRILMTLTTVLMMGIHCKAQINNVFVDSIFQNVVIKDLFEGTVLIAEKGNIVYHKSFGFKDYEKLVPTTDTTHFGISSITKLFTAIVTMQLVEKGKFQLSDNLKTLLPEFEIPESNKITTHHLLLHISGLPNEDDEIYSEPKSPKEFVIETLSNKSNHFDSFNYVNIDYVLLGLIIEKFDKKSWKQSVQNRILDTVEMKNTGFLEMNKYPEDFAGYLKLFGLKHVRTSIMYPQSNGKIERFHRTITTECLRKKSMVDLNDARRQIANYVEFYNTKRLHSALNYLTPDDYVNGRKEERLKERESKLIEAKKVRYEAANVS